ncbi:MAG: alpha/beta hydrolase [Planctomycetes bacterium]|nr:alpha/beta hydrolase [Planctomycetota bacterium]
MKTDELLSCVELEPKGPARCAVIWLHGLGADGHDFPPIVPELALDPRVPVRFVFPHAPKIPVTINGGMVMRAWYDIRGFEPRKMHDWAGVERSVADVRALIARENRRGVPCERIVLAGFSQGGAIALQAGLRHEASLLGIVALSTYLACEDELVQRLSPANRKLPIFQAHGQLDPMVPIERGRAAMDRLLELGYPLERHEYAMAHQVCLEEIEALGAWLRARFASVA